MENNQKRKLIKTSDIVAIAIVLILCALAVYFINSSKAEGLTAEISYKGRVVKTIELDTASDETFIFMDNKAVSFQIFDGKIRFINTDCPDKLCENFGFLKKSNESAICLPNKVSLKLVGKKKALDDVDIIAN